jgi:hypothetical protein
MSLLRPIFSLEPRTKGFFFFLRGRLASTKQYEEGDLARSELHLAKPRGANLDSVFCGRTACSKIHVAARNVMVTSLSRGQVHS